MNKIYGLPSIKYINLDTHNHRMVFMENNFKKYNIKNYERFNAIRYSNISHQYMNSNEIGCMLSHLTLIRDFYLNSKDDMMIIMEDDIDISSIENWDFSWQEFIKAMPDFEVLQLFRNQISQKYAKLKQWDWEDKSTAAYVITQEYAKKISYLYKRSKNLHLFPSLSEDPEFTLQGNVGPVADYALYKNFNCWSTSIFKQVLKFDDVWSSTSTSAEPPEWFVKQNKEINDFWSKNHGLDEIL